MQQIGLWQVLAAVAGEKRERDMGLVAKPAKRYVQAPNHHRAPTIAYIAS